MPNWKYVNHHMYAEDLIIFCSYSAGLGSLLKTYPENGFEFHIKYNSIKSNVMIVKSKEDKKLCFPHFHLFGEVLNIYIQAWSFYY